LDREGDAETSDRAELRVKLERGEVAK